MVRRGNHRVTWAEAFRDVVIVSINKGQFMALAVTGVVALIIFKMPEERVADLADQIVEEMARLSLVGYVAFFITLLFWSLHARSMRRRESRELERMGKEKSELQAKLAGVSFKSSN